MSGAALASTVALVTALVSTSFGQLSYKLFFDQRRGQPLDWRRLRSWRLAAACTLFGIAQIGFFLALRGLPVGTVYMSTGVTQVIVLGLSRVVLHEAVGRDHLIAVGLILTGLALYAG